MMDENVLSNSYGIETCLVFMDDGILPLQYLPIAASLQYKECYVMFLLSLFYSYIHISGLEISQKKICGGECDSCKF